MPLLAVCFLMAGFAAASGQEAEPQVPAPGVTASWRWEPASADLLVRLPEDYDPARSWPVVVFFHGQNGAPALGPLVEATGGRGFVLVGMAYLQKGPLRGGSAAVQKEWGNARDAVRRLAEKISLDEKRLYVAGFSQGGWVASLVLEGYPQTVAGAWIGGAGLSPRLVPYEGRPMPGKPVYLGIGETDINRMATLAAIDQFSGLGAQITYDEYEGAGHVWRVTEAMTHWFRIEAMRGADHFEREVAGLFEAACSEADATEAPVARWLAWRRLLHDPRSAAAGPKAAARVQRRLAELQKSPLLAAEVQAAAAFEKLIRIEVAQRENPSRAATLAEARAREIERKQANIESWRQFAAKHAGTSFTDRAQKCIERIQAHLELMRGASPD